MFQSIFMPVASTTGLHFVISAWMYARAIAGLELIVGSIASRASCSCSEASLMTFAVAADRDWIMGAAVAAGAASVFHSLASNPLVPMASSTEGNSGASGERLAVAIATMRSFPA